MSGIHNILVPTDFSPASDIALQYAIDMAPSVGGRIHLLHVIDEGHVAAAYPDGIYIPELRERLIKAATESMQKAAARCASAGVQATADVLTGPPAYGIVQTAKSQGTDLIVMGTHGRGAFAHFLLGSVAERVVRMAPCAVLTVRDSSRLADLLAAEQAAAVATTRAS